MNTQRRWSMILVLLTASACAASAPKPMLPEGTAPQDIAKPQTEAPTSTSNAAVPAPAPVPVPVPAPAPVPAPVPAPAPVQAEPSTLRWRLEITPKTMSMAGRARCRVRITVDNAGSESVAPNLHLGKFTVDGQPSMAGDLAFGNGAMEPRSGWILLAPGKTVSMEREVCEGFFPTPGKYTVAFQIGAASASAVARVTP